MSVCIYVYGWVVLYESVYVCTLLYEFVCFTFMSVCYCMAVFVFTFMNVCVCVCVPVLH